MSGGWLRRPTREIVAELHGVTVRQCREAVLVNGDDPDVRFAYSFSGSCYSLDAATVAAERGRQKARFAPMPEMTLVSDAEPVAHALRSLPGVTLDIECDSDGPGWQARATLPALGIFVSMNSVDRVLELCVEEGQFSVTKLISFVILATATEDLVASTIAQARTQIAAAEGHWRAIEAAGVAVDPDA